MVDIVPTIKLVPGPTGPHNGAERVNVEPGSPADEWWRGKGYQAESESVAAAPARRTRRAAKRVGSIATDATDAG